MESSRAAPPRQGGRLALPTVTLCAAASVNVAATIAALRFSLDRIDVAECLLFTDQAVAPGDDRIRVVPITRLTSAEHYSYFVLRDLADQVRSEHCLVVQWDGFVLDPNRWNPEFLEYDYIGATWPQFSDGFDVGNGGFSLRSRRLLAACRDPKFLPGHPEDVAICRTNRTLLDRHGIRFASRKIAQQFSFERTAPTSGTFGFHGVFNMIPAIGHDRFWEVYRSLDDRSSAAVDYGLLMRQLGSGANSLVRRSVLTVDYLSNLIERAFRSMFGPLGRNRSPGAASGG